MITRPISHIGFSDESHWTRGRYRSIGLITMPLEESNGDGRQLQALIDKSNVSEFKWNNLRSAKLRFAAEKMCKLAVELAVEGRMRVDVLIWDTRDERHDVQGRDDTQNLGRMYYHLFRTVLRRHWPDHSVWRLCPDEHTAIDWNNLSDILGHVARSIEPVPPLLRAGNGVFDIRYEFNAEDICQVDSRNHPIIQLADLFAGLAVFSRERYDEYEVWYANDPCQLTLWPLSERVLSPSRASVERFHVLRAFNKSCKAKRLGMSLHSEKGLHTFDPSKPINFWLYRPQHEHDRAPRKGEDGRGHRNV